MASDEKLGAAIALNWYRNPRNDAGWTALVGALGNALAKRGALARQFVPYTGDRTVALLGAPNPDAAKWALAQCCGVDAWALRGQVVPIAAPVFSHTRQPGWYRSLAVAAPGVERAGTALFAAIMARQLRLVLNQPGSWSGSLCAQRALLHAGYGRAQVAAALWPRLPVSGGHQASLAALAAGTADVAFVDENSWHLGGGANAWPTLRLVGRSAAMPACPLVVPAGQPDLAGAVRAVLTPPYPPGLGRAMTALGIVGFHLDAAAFWTDAFDAAMAEISDAGAAGY